MIRRAVRILVYMTKISYRKQYLFLGLLLLTGLLLALATLIGLDQRIGWIAAGSTIGVQVAFQMLRTAQVRTERLVSEMAESSANAAAPAPSIAQPVEFIRTSDSLVISEPATGEPETVTAAVPANVIQLDPVPEASNTSEPQPVAPVTAPEDMCACACSCQNDANGGFEGLCADCRSSRLQQSLVCECDYTSTATCTCGVVTHWPTTVEADLVAAG